MRRMAGSTTDSDVAIPVVMKLPDTVRCVWRAAHLVFISARDSIVDHDLVFAMTGVCTVDVRERRWSIAVAVCVPLSGTLFVEASQAWIERPVIPARLSD